MSSVSRLFMEGQKIMAYKLGTSYFSTRILPYVLKDLKEIKKQKCTFVLHTFDEIDLYYNQENMKRITAMSHKLGLEVYYSPWAMGGVFGGECFSRFVMQHPDACQVLSTGERVGNACLRQPKFRDYVKTWVEACAQAGGDVLFWDEPHLWIAEWNDRISQKDEFSCCCSLCRSDFEKIHGKPMPVTMTGEIKEFRDATLVDFLAYAAKTAKQVKPKFKNAVCLLPNDKRWPNPIWENLAKLPEVDILATDPYWKQRPYKTGAKVPLEGFVDNFAGKISEIAKRYKKEAQGWIQLYAIDKKGEKDITTALRIWEKSGVKNIAAWGFKACESYSLLASERPQECWKRMGDYFKKLSKKK
jgi:hypothetical protein